MVSYRLPQRMLNILFKLDMHGHVQTENRGSALVMLITFYRRPSFSTKVLSTGAVSVQ